LHAVARELLAEYRELEDMPADARARVRRALAAGPRRRDPVVGMGTRSWVVWSLVGAAAGVALLLGLEAVAPMFSAEREKAPLEVAPDRADREAKSSRAGVRDPGDRARNGARSPAAATPGDAVAPEASDPTPSSDTPVSNPDVSARERTRSSAEGGASESSRPRDRSPREPPRAEPTVAPSASTLDAERRLIAQAWSDLTAGDPSAALRGATAHRDRFPSGVLVPERLAVEAIAHCKRDADDSRAHAFLKAHARSPLAARVRSACAITSAGSSDPRTPTGR
jgi:hypothetical protein